MHIHKLFAAEMQAADALATTRRSLRKRDRRIAFLLKRLRQTRSDAARVIDRKNEIIAGLEQALMTHAPVVENPADERIADLEAQLEAMTSLAETLSERVSQVAT